MEGEGDAILPLLDVDGVHRADGGLFHAGIAAEGGKIVLTRQIGSGLPHPLHIGDIGQHGHILSVEDGLDLSHEHRIAIGLAQGVVPGVEPRRTGLHLPHGDGVRQIAVAVVPDLLRRLLHVQLGVGHHGPGVNARIGAACADDLHRLARKAGQYRLYFALNGLPVRLALPAEKPRAVIGDGKFIILHIISAS